MTRLELAGDASTRRFFRVGSNGASAVSIEYGHPLDASGEAFVAVAGYLARLGLPVPRVLEVHPAEGIILVEDLGDVMLEDVVLGGRAGWRPLYEEAVDVLLALQAGGRDRPDPSCPAFSVVHDEEKLSFELDFFRRHFLEGLRGLRPGAAELQALEDALAGLSTRVAAFPRALCHRDYHARNLMVDAAGRLRLVDFQDARLGPRLYDLASLLYDSYVTLDAATVEALFRRFAGEAATELREELHVTAAQRNLKALGTFGYQIHVRGKERYRDAIPRTLGHLAGYMAQTPPLAPVLRALGPLLPELAG